MAKIPHDKSLDSTLAVMQDGYAFIQKICNQNNSDIVKIRLMGKPAICMHGEEAAAIFYDPERFIRKGAIPKRVQKTLLGENGIQTLDNAVHRQRKEMFMSLMSRANIEHLLALVQEQWQACLRKWEQEQEVVLFEEMQEILCRVACAWAGVPLKEKEVRPRANDFAAMVDAFGGAGPRHSRGKDARKRTEKWIRNVIKQIRNGELTAVPGTAAHTMAFHLEPDGEPMERQMAAVELINIIRPIVAISWYITFAALALHQYPVYRQRVTSGEENYGAYFMQEVRRYYPFAPFLGARVRDTFEWQSYRFRKGTLVLLDVYGTLHDGRYWERPDEFWPDRFRDWKGSRFDFIPQGGGNYLSGHRCAGEMITIEILKQGITFLTQSMTYEVPEQDLHFSLARMPTYPESGFMMTEVKSTGNFYL